MQLHLAPCLESVRMPSQPRAPPFEHSEQPAGGLHHAPHVRMPGEGPPGANVTSCSLRSKEGVSLCDCFPIKAGRRPRGKSRPKTHHQTESTCSSGRRPLSCPDGRHSEQGSAALSKDQERRAKRDVERTGGGGVERMLPWLETSSAATIAARTAARLETRCWNRDDAGTGTILEEARHGNRMASRGRRRKDTTSIEWHCGARGKAGNVSSLT